MTFKTTNPELSVIASDRGVTVVPVSVSGHTQPTTHTRVSYKTFAYKYYRQNDGDTAGGGCSRSGSTKENPVNTIYLSPVAPATQYTVKIYTGGHRSWRHYDDCYTELASTQVTTLATRTFPNASLTVSDVTATSMEVSVEGHENEAFHYKYSPGGTCTPSGNSHWNEVADFSLTGLKAETVYTVATYLDNACTDKIAETTEVTEFATLAATYAGFTSVTLAVGNHGTTNWHYKYSPGGTCTASLNSSADPKPSFEVTSLETGTAYTFTTYSDSACQDEITSVSAQTRPLAILVGDVFLDSARLTLQGHAEVYGSKSWWYKDLLQHSLECSAAQTGPSAEVTGLLRGQAYNIVVYTDSNCWHEINPDIGKSRVSFTTLRSLQLAPGKIADRSATLTISHHGHVSRRWGGWHYRRTSPVVGDCSPRQTEAAAHVSGLRVGITYTFKAYRDSACAVELTDDGSDADFTTSAVPPSLAKVSAESESAVLEISGYTGGWHYQRTAPTPAGSCSAEHTLSRVRVTGLGANTAYTYAAYSDSACSIELASASFTTRPAGLHPRPDPDRPSAYLHHGDSALGATRASLAISGHTGGWWYKADTGPHTACSAKQAGGAAAEIGGLTDNTSYVYSAYRDSTCSSAGELTDSSTRASFTTRAAGSVALATTDFRGNSVELVISGWDGAWWHEGEYTTLDHRTLSTSCERASAAKSRVSLAAAMDYTYKAYRDSACAVELTDDANDAEFSTYELAFSPAPPTLNSNTHAAPDLYNTTFTLRNWSEPKLATVGFTTKNSAPTLVVYWHVNTAYLSVSTHSGSWWYKADTGPHSANCTKVTMGAIPARLDGLTSGGYYSYTAYSDATCSTRLASTAFYYTAAAPYFSNVSQISANGAKLTLSGHSGAWWYKADQAPHTDCQGPVTGAASLTGLTADRYYTYTGYNDVSCRGGWGIRASGSSQCHRGGAATDSHGNTVYQVEVDDLKPGATYAFTAYKNSDCGGDTLAAATTFAVPGSAPALTVEGVSSTSVELSLSDYTGTWHYHLYRRSANPPTDTPLSSCSTASNPKVFPGGLTPGTVYVYKAFRPSPDANVTPECDDSLLITDSEPFETPDLEVTSLWRVSPTGGNSARLALPGYKSTGSWWYKALAHSHLLCQGQGGTVGTPGYVGGFASGASADLLDDPATQATEGLLSSKSYTIYAYSDSSCSTLVDTVSFSTLGDVPALSMTRYSKDRAWLRLKNYTGLWWYKLSGGTTCAAAGTSRSLFLEGLAPGAAYAYTAYADSSCAPAWEVAATASFTPAELAHENIARTSATLRISGWDPAPAKDGSWYYQADRGPHTSCEGPVNSTTESLTGLTKATTYVYTAYSDHSCTHHATDPALNKQLDSTTFTTLSDPALTARGRTDVTAELALSGHSGGWHYQADKSPHTSCSSRVAGTTAALTGLTAGTAYAYTAYSDHSCTGPVSLAVTVLQNSDKATLALSGHSGNWYYQADIGPHTSCQGHVSGTTKLLTGLTVGTMYVYTAYADSACTAARQLAATTFRGGVSRALAVSGIFQDRAVLDMSGVSIGGWYYQAGAGPHSRTCQHVGGGATDAAIVGLTAGTVYTYTAYGNSACTTVTAAATFDTGRVIAPAATLETALLSPVHTYPGAADTAFTVGIEHHSGPWWFSVVQGAHLDALGYPVLPKTSDPLTAYDCVGVADGNSQGSVTGLVTVSEYTVTAYSTDECLPGGQIETAATGTTGLRPAAVQNTSAVLRLYRYKYSGGWWYQADKGPHSSSCQGPVALPATDATLTGLTKDTAYTYTAYNNSSCSSTGSGNEAVATLSFQTANVATGLTAHGVTDASAVLRLVGYTGAWWYELTGGADPNLTGACEGPVAAATASTTGSEQPVVHAASFASGSAPSSGYTYRYAAYSDAACSSLIDGTEPLPLPWALPQPALSAVRVSDRNAVLRLTGYSNPSHGVAPFQTITIPANSTSASKTFALTPVDGSSVTGDRTVTIVGAYDHNGTHALTVNTPAITITDDDSCSSSCVPTGISLAIEDSTSNPLTSIAEDAGATDVTVVASVQGGGLYTSDIYVTVEIGSSGSTAVEGSGGDYNTTASQITIKIPDDSTPANRTSASKTFTLTPVDGSSVTGPKTVFIAGSYTVFGRTSATSNIPAITITDDDSCASGCVPTGISLAIEDSTSNPLTSIAEDAGATSVTVIATVQGGAAYTADKTVIVDIGSVGSTAVEGSGGDYTTDIDPAAAKSGNYRWWYKDAALSSCVAAYPQWSQDPWLPDAPVVGLVALTGLSPGASHTYTAYNSSSCDPAHQVGSAVQFITPSLGYTVSSVVTGDYGTQTGVRMATVDFTLYDIPADVDEWQLLTTSYDPVKKIYFTWCRQLPASTSTVSADLVEGKWAAYVYTGNTCAGTIHGGRLSDHGLTVFARVDLARPGVRQLAASRQPIAIGADALQGVLTRPGRVVECSDLTMSLADPSDPGAGVTVHTDAVGGGSRIRIPLKWLRVDDSDGCELSMSACPVSHEIVAKTATVNVKYEQLRASPLYEGYCEGVFAYHRVFTAFTATTGASYAAVSGVTDDGATLELPGRTGWHYQADTGPHTACQGPVSGPTEALTGLTSDTYYSYTAYSDSGCNSRVAAVSFHTLSGTTSFTLQPPGGFSYTLWWYKANTGPDSTTCSGPYHKDTSKTIRNLNPNVAYEYYIYHIVNSTDPICDDSMKDHTEYVNTLSGIRAAVSGVTAGGATLGLPGRVGNWYYKADSAPHAACSSPVVGTTTLTGLAKSTEYTYTYYRDYQCTASQRLAQAVFTTAGAPYATATGIVAGGATLELPGQTDPWYYKADSGLHSTCQGPIGSASVSINVLTPGDDYTYTAYSDSACTEANRIAATTFIAWQLPVSLAVTGTVADGVELTLTAASGGRVGGWYYQADTGPDSTDSVTGNPVCRGPVSGATAILSGLTSGDDYTYTAYSDSACTVSADSVQADLYSRCAALGTLLKGGYIVVTSSSAQADTCSVLTAARCPTGVRVSDTRCRVVVKPASVCGLPGQHTSRIVDHLFGICRPVLSSVSQTHIHPCWGDPNSRKALPLHAGAPNLAMAACEDYVGSDYFRYDPKITGSKGPPCADYAKSRSVDLDGDGHPAYDGDPAPSDADEAANPTAYRMEANPSSADAAFHWCRYDASFFDPACHDTVAHTPPVGSHCAAKNALCLKRPSGIGGCDTIARILKCRYLQQVYIDISDPGDKNSAARAIRAEHCNPCLILPFQPVPTGSCPTDISDPTDLDTLKTTLASAPSKASIALSEIVLDNRTDIHLDRRITAGGVSASCGTWLARQQGQTAKTVADYPGCELPNSHFPSLPCPSPTSFSGRLSWQSSHTSQLAVVNSAVTFGLHDVNSLAPVSRAVDALALSLSPPSAWEVSYRLFEYAAAADSVRSLPYSYTGSSIAASPSQSARDQTDAALKTMMKQNDANANTPDKEKAQFGECTLQDSPVFRLSIRQLWPDGDDAAAIKDLFGPQELCWWEGGPNCPDGTVDGLSQAVRLRRTRARGLTPWVPASQLTPAQQIQQREDRDEQLTATADCYVGSTAEDPAWCRWSPTRSGYFKVSLESAWLLRKWDNRAWRDPAAMRTALQDPNVYNAVGEFANERVTNNLAANLNKALADMGLRTLGTGYQADTYPTGHPDAGSEIDAGPDTWLYRDKGPDSRRYRCPATDMRVECGPGHRIGMYTRSAPDSDIGIVVHEVRTSTRPRIPEKCTPTSVPPMITPTLSVTGDEVQAAWAPPPASSCVTEYRVDWRIFPGPIWSAEQTLSGSARSHTFTLGSSYTAGKEFRMRIKAVNARGAGPGYKDPQTNLWFKAIQLP